jgi:hypothetical protein
MFSGLTPAVPAYAASMRRSRLHRSARPSALPV